MILSILRISVFLITLSLFYVNGMEPVSAQILNSIKTSKNLNLNSYHINDSQSQLLQDSKHVNIMGRFGLSNGNCYDVFVKDNIAYFGDGEYLKIVDVSDPANPVELSKMELYSPIISGIFVSGNYVFVANHLKGLVIIDVSNPSAPGEVWHTEGSAIAVAVSGNYVYLADYYEGLRIIDISKPTQPKQVGCYGAFESAVGVAVLGNYAYVAYCLCDLRIIDISDPSNPNEVGYYDTGGSAMGVAVSGNLAYVADKDTGLRIIDVRNTSYPEEIGFYETKGTVKAVSLSDDRAYVAVGDSGLRIIDVSDPSSPEEIGYFEPGGFTEEVFSSENYIYMVEFSDGLYILKYEDVASSTIEEHISVGILERFQLSQNYPNPFNSGTTIKYQLDTPNNVTLSIHNIVGQVVRILVNESQKPGDYSVMWDVCNSGGIQVPNGIYLYSLKVGNFIQTRKMVFKK